MRQPRQYLSVDFLAAVRTVFFKALFCLSTIKATICDSKIHYAN